MFRIYLLPFFLFFFSGIYAQMNPAAYYSIHYKAESGDTTGLHEKIFNPENNKIQNDFYLTLARGDYFFASNEKEKAVDEYTLALSLSQKNDTLSALANYKIGYLYCLHDNYTEALKYLNKASLIINYSPQNYQQAKLYHYIGLVHSSLGSNEESKKSYHTSLEFYRKKNDTKRMASAQNNLALVLMDDGKYDEARLYLDSCLAERIKRDDHYLMGQTYNNIGTLNYKKGDYKNALGNYITGYEERIIGKAPESGLIESQINIGKTYRKMGDIENALYWLEQGLIAAKKQEHYELLRRVTEELKDIYFNKGDYKLAFELQELYYTTKDSLYGLDKKLAIENLTLQSHFEMKIRQDSISNAQKSMTDKMMAEEKEKRNNMIVYSLSGGLLFLMFFIFQLYRSNLHKKKTNALILLQKDSLDQKQKEILDSINYAKKIQFALLAHDDLLKKNLPEHFILFKPKDIVSGDFYWATEKISGLEFGLSGSDTQQPGTQNPKLQTDFYFAICDSTGHGVPGAFMSLLNTSFLNEAVNEKNISKPNEILNYVRKRLVENISHEGARDGMDGVLLKVESAKLNVNSGKNFQPSTFNLQLEYSAANNSPLIIRNKKIIDLPFDKMPVGKGHKEDNFKLFTFDLQKGDMLYLFTDGYADQFGGENFSSSKAGGKKFKKTNLKKLLAEIAHFPLNEQKNKLELSFESWSGDLEQVDDVCVIGIRI